MDNKSQIKQNIKNATVSINCDVFKSAYAGAIRNSYGGSGFIINKEKGWVVTNKHVVSRDKIMQIYVSFLTGNKLEAQLLYDDPMHDFAILKIIDINKIPEAVTEAKLSKEDIRIDEKVFIIGNNEGIEFSFQDGTVIDKYSSLGHFSQQTIKLSLNTRPGSSGSAVCNDNGEVIALNFGGTETSALALPISYIIDAIDQLDHNEIPIRKDIGAQITYCNLHDLERFNHFPQEQSFIYSENFPDSLNRALCVKKIINDNASKKLEVLDVLWKINGNYIGPDLYELHKIINHSEGPVNLDVYRLGEAFSVNINIYNLEDTSIKKMLYFGGAIFYEVDEFTHMVKGVPLGAVFTYVVGPTSAFTSLSSSVIEKLDKFYIHNLDDFIKTLPELVSIRDFIAIVNNYEPEVIFNGIYSTGYKEHLNYISLDKINEAILYVYDNNAHEWKENIITLDLNIYNSQNVSLVIEEQLSDATIYSRF